MAGVAKVTLNGSTLIDVTQDTVTPNSMLDGITALAKNGDRAVGTITGTGSATTGISIADHSTTTIYGVGSTTTSVTGVQSSTTTASKVTLGTAISVPNVTAAGSGSFTQGSFSGGSITVSNHIMSFTPATHGTDSHTHTAPTLGTAISVPNVTAATDVTVPIKATSATTIPVKNSNSTTVVTTGTHSITDAGHAHTIGS